MKKRTILKRLLVINITIVLGVVLMISVAISYLQIQGFYNREYDRLSSIGLRVQKLVDQQSEGLIEPSSLQIAIDAMTQIIEGKLYILNLSEETLKNLNNSAFSSEDVEAYLYEDLISIMNGYEVFRNSQYSKSFDTVMMFYGRPLTDGQEIIGAIIIYEPVTNISEDIRSLLLIIAFIGLIVILLAIAAIYIMTKKITNPILEVSSAAHHLANGLTISKLNKADTYELTILVESFEWMKQQLESIELEKQEYISMISHDIKTPLMVINGYLEAIQVGLIKSDDLNQTLVTMQNEIRRLTQLTKDIVDQSKGKNIGYVLYRTQFSLVQLIKEMLKWISTQCEKTIEFTLDLPEELMIYADVEKIKQILINVLSNAVKYSHDEVILKVICKEHKEYILIEIRDHGIGISPSSLEQIFEPYYRAPELIESDQQTEGQGIGLSSVKKLMDLHHGEVNIESQLGQGTMVQLIFPK